VSKRPPTIVSVGTWTPETGYRAAVYYDTLINQHRCWDWLEAMGVL
jgi:hypothetical protein